MKSDFPSPVTPNAAEELNAPSSRLTDEKISDNSETKVDSAFAPAGLKNPFWSPRRPKSTQDGIAQR
ncbi:MAG: hypothetical protein ABSF97_14735 [Candidatus Sulfotelmatobacter sp.]|jgi:hypothetical protein